MYLGPTIFDAEYRISQVSDSGFVVEKLYTIKPNNFWPWERKSTTQAWERVRFCGSPLAPAVPEFKSVDAAQKWIDDKRKYPIVVKSPA